MRRNRLLSFAFLAAVSLAFAAQDSVTLRRELKEDSSQTYKMTMDLKQTIDTPTTGQQDMPMTSSMTYLFKLGKVDTTAQTADVVIKMTDIKFEIGGPFGAMAQGQMGQMPKVIESTAKLDSRSRLSGMKFKDAGAGAMFDQMQAQSWPMFVEFPEKAVKVGDTWDVVIPKTDVIPGGTMKAKLAGEKEFGGKPVWILNMDGTLPIDVDSSKMKAPPAGAPAMPVRVKGTTEAHVIALVDKATGITLQVDTKVKSHTTTAVAGMSVESSGEGTVSMVLQK